MSFRIENNVLVDYKEEAGVTEVVIPEGVTSIGDSAFQDVSDDFKIICPKGSAIEEYAKENDINYEIIE